MDALESNFLKLGKYLVGALLIWLGVVGLLDTGFTTVVSLPVVEFEYLPQVIFAFQILIGLSIFNRSFRNFAKPVAIIYFLLIIYTAYASYAVMFSPAIPYLSDLGRNMFLETFLIYAGFGYLNRYKL